MKDIYIKDDNNFYRKIHRYLKRKEIVHLIYKNNDIIDDTNIDKFSEIKFKIQAIHAINIKNIKERYSYIYDVVCSYLDSEFKTKDICNFENNKCISVRNNSHCSNSLHGCCYGKNRGLCKNFINSKCNIKSISCKLFTCRYLKKNKIKYSINSIPLLKYFFNIKQKFILDTSIFKDKDEIINLLLRNS